MALSDVPEYLMAAIRGGEKLEAALREISRKVSKAATLRVGFLEGATYPDGTPVALVAAVQEYGSATVGQRTHAGKIRAIGASAVARELEVQGPGIPPRPYFRNMIAEKSPSWGGAVETNLVAQKYDVEKTLSLVGEGIKGQLQQSIQQMNSPPLAEATIAAKGFDKPLIDTNHMMNSADFEVKT